MPTNLRRAMSVVAMAALGAGACSLGACAGGPDRASARPDRPAAHPALAPFAPLAGRWRSERDGGVMEEVWFEPAGSNMTGMLRWIDAEGSARMLELLSLTAEPGGVRFRIRHFDHAMTPWASEADGPMESVATGTEGGVLVFRSVARGRQTVGMRYDVSTPDRLTVTLVFEGGREPLVIPFERAVGP